MVWFVVCGVTAQPNPFGTASEQFSGRAQPPRMLMPSRYAREWRDASHESSLAALDAFVSQFTSVVATYSHKVRVVNSEGGAAGGVVSEGQGYGLLLAASTLAVLPHHHERRMQIEELAYELYLGWRRMCERTVRNSCQDSHKCGEDEQHECLAGWKFDEHVDMEVGTGSASDGDADAILGMILLVLAAEMHADQGAASSVQYSAASEHSAAALLAADETPSWEQHLMRWTYQSCRAFVTYLTTTQAAAAAAKDGIPTALSWGAMTNRYYTGHTPSGAAMRILKLGSCWGGWDCSNPSYLAPAHYRVFRDFMLAFSHIFGSSPHEGATVAPYWDSLIETSYWMLNDAQCPATGLVPNWFVPICEAPGAEAGCAGCAASGTPADEFGSEAARTGWRVALDVLWFGDESDGEGTDARGERYGGRSFVRRMARQVAPALLDGIPLDVSAHEAEEETDGACHVRSVWGGDAWSDEGFMLGPTSAVLAVTPEAEEQPSVLIVRTAAEVPHAQQQEALDRAADMLARQPIATSHYYAGAWLALSTLTLSGELPSLGPLLLSLRARTPPAPPSPPPPHHHSLYGRGPPPPPESLLVDRMENNLAAMHEDNIVAFVLLLLLLLPLVVLLRSVLLGASRRRRQRPQPIPSFAPTAGLTSAADDMDTDMPTPRGRGGAAGGKGGDETAGGRAERGYSSTQRKGPPLGLIAPKGKRHAKKAAAVADEAPPLSSDDDFEQADEVKRERKEQAKRKGGRKGTRSKSRRGDEDAEVAEFL